MSRTTRGAGPQEAVATLPRREPSRGLVSRRSLVVGLGLAVLAVVLYYGARETSLFAVRSIDVRGAPPPLAAKVESALSPLEGKSLLSLDGAQVARLASTLPGVASVSYDRAFPSTLRVDVRPEVPLAVVRRGLDAWLVARSGRVIARIAQHTHRSLPRIWLKKSFDVALGRPLAAGGGAEEVEALDPVAGSSLASRITSVRVTGGQDIYVLRGGLELRAGEPSNLPLKLAVAARILSHTTVHGYLDVSVAERPVAGPDPQVSG